jgi:hypothetical protein
LAGGFATVEVREGLQVRVPGKVKTHENHIGVKELKGGREMFRFEMPQIRDATLGRGAGRRPKRPARAPPKAFPQCVKGGLVDRVAGAYFGHGILDLDLSCVCRFCHLAAQVAFPAPRTARRNMSAPVTLYRFVDPNGNLGDYGKRVLGA